MAKSFDALAACPLDGTVLRDIQAAGSRRVQALALPKIKSADHVRMIAEGRGAIVLEGRMIDMLIVERARHLLERHRSILAREEKPRR